MITLCLPWLNHAQPTGCRRVTRRRPLHSLSLLSSPKHRVAWEALSSWWVAVLQIRDKFNTLLLTGFDEIIKVEKCIIYIYIYKNTIISWMKKKKAAKLFFLFFITRPCALHLLLSFMLLSFILYYFIVRWPWVTWKAPPNKMYYYYYYKYN